MAIFAIISQPDKDAGVLKARVESEFAAAIYPLSNEVWLVAAQGTAEQISDRIGLRAGTDAAGAAVVVEMASYFGLANPAIWSWIKANWEARPVG